MKFAAGFALASCTLVCSGLSCAGVVLPAVGSSVSLACKERLLACHPCNTSTTTASLLGVTRLVYLAC